MSTSSTSMNLSTLSKQKSSHAFRIILQAAVASRVFLLALMILWRSFVSPYDTSATLNPDCISSDSNTTISESKTILLPSIGSAIEGSIVWDGVYFVRIAQCGYEYEQTYAFLPLLPFCLHTLTRTVFAPLVPFIGYRAVLGLSGYFINNIAFVFAAAYFYRLSVTILKDEKAALRSSLLFCFNPASIFYSSVYSESLYALLSLGGVCHLLSGSNTIAMLLLALSGSARSNGVLNAGYFCFQAMHQAYDAIFQKKRACLAVLILVTGALRSLCIFVPFIAFQVYGYNNLCLGRLSKETSPWCKARLPFLYDYLQSRYWDVGFLRYFQLKQLPNFLLASPILSLALCSIVHYAKSRPEIVLSLGFQASCEEKKIASVLYSLEPITKKKGSHVPEDLSFGAVRDPMLRRRKEKSKDEATDSSTNPIPSDYATKRGFSSISVLPFVLHLSFMAVTAFLVMHVQVATRFLSSSPPLYWFASYIMISPGTGRRWGYLIWVYSVAYILLGSLLFSNFYPFT